MADCRVWDFIWLVHAFPSLQHPSRLSLMHFNWTTNKVSLAGAAARIPPGHMTSKGANQLMSSKPNHERVSVACCT